MAAPAKAYFEVETAGGTPRRLTCLYNPDSLSLNRSNTWAEKSGAGKGESPLTYGGAGAGDMGFQLIFDTSATGRPVTAHTSKIVELMDVVPGLPGTDEASGNTRPPYVVFHWGDQHSFKAVVTSVNLSFTYFSSSGIPLRATADLSLMQYDGTTNFGPQNPTSGTPRPQRTHRVLPGETLDRISARYYGDATRWRLIADANGVEDPLAIRPGRLLEVPRSEGR